MIDSIVLPNYDELDIRNSSETSGFFNDAEQIIFSSTVSKINKRRVSQERILVITNKFLYNICFDGFLTKLSLIFKRNSAIKRKISIERIPEITLSVDPSSTQMIIHVDKEYDYRYEAGEKRNKIVEAIISARFEMGHQEFGLYFKDDYDLYKFQTSQADCKRKISKRPQRNKLIVTPELLQKGVEFILMNRIELLQAQVANSRSNPDLSQEKENTQVASPKMTESIPSASFNRNRPINCIDDIPLAISGALPKSQAQSPHEINIGGTQSFMRSN